MSSGVESFWEPETDDRGLWEDTRSDRPRV